MNIGSNNGSPSMHTLVQANVNSWAVYGCGTSTADPVCASFPLRMMYYSVMTQANSEKEIPSAPIRSRTY